MASDPPPPPDDGIPMVGDETPPLIPYRLTIDKAAGRFPSLGVAGGEVEQRYEIPDEHFRVLFHALCCKHGVMIYRRPGHGAETICVRASVAMHDSILWPQYLELSRQLDDELVAVIRAFGVRHVPGGLRGQ